MKDTSYITQLEEAVKDADRSFSGISDERYYNPIAVSLGWLLRHCVLRTKLGLLPPFTKEKKDDSSPQTNK